uniref:Major facilitator superfamily (MFS) profile domain-containing protein n=1 Tax=Timema douglasi TaxID=61478 RepID=A0A7R8VJL2_TIMDO|nr:unnamed protein product [Timema douglasi]
MFSGMVIAYAEGMYLSWRTVAWLSLVYIAISLILVTAWIPESPLWLVARGRVDEADHSLKWFNGKNTQIHKEKLASMVKSQDMKALVSSGFSQRMRGFLKPTGYKPMLVLSGLFFFQQFSGIYSTLFYAVTFFEDVGSGIDPTFATVLMGSVRCLMSGCNTGLMKRFGRRPLCMLSGCGMAICLSVSGYFTWRILKEGDKELNWVPVLCIMLYVVTSMLGLLSIPWTMTAELFPTEIRGLAHSIAISVANLLMFVSIQTYLNTVEVLGGPAQPSLTEAAGADNDSALRPHITPLTDPIGSQLEKEDKTQNEIWSSILHNLGDQAQLPVPGRLVITVKGIVITFTGVVQLTTGSDLKRDTTGTRYQCQPIDLDSVCPLSQAHLFFPTRDYCYNTHQSTKRLPSVCVPPSSAAKTMRIHHQSTPSTSWVPPWNHSLAYRQRVRLSPDCKYEYIAADYAIAVWGTLDDADIVSGQQESSDKEGEVEM